MITAVDTNILLDVFGADPVFGQASARLLNRCLAEGAVTACALVWTETAAAFPSREAFSQAMSTLGIGFDAISQASALEAASAWRAYRAQGGKKDRVAADFLIGAHARHQCDRLLTRDRGFYRGYFQSLNVLNPLVAKNS